MQNVWMIIWRQLAEQSGCDLHSDTTGILCIYDESEEILSKTKIVDLSADFRIKDVKAYEKWYGIEHKSSSVYRRSGLRTV